MPAAVHEALRQFLSKHAEQPSLHALHEELIGILSSQADAIPGPGDAFADDALLDLYKKAVPQIEKAIAATDFSTDAVQCYQNIFRELEALIEYTGTDDRYSFTVVIPVADRPRHLEACLSSLLELCHAFGYGGLSKGRYRKVMAIIADDSKHAENIDSHRDIAHRFNQHGLETLYFGLDEQLAQLDRLPASIRHELANIVGTVDTSAFYHKGPSILRNIVYLKLNDMWETGGKRLVHFVDSDQEFRVKIGRKNGDDDVYAINYFYHLDRIFSETDIEVLTGKVVGDPPVSPAVMAGTFLDDVNGFLKQIVDMPNDASCLFHGQTHAPDTGAAYHDMPGLFGFGTEEMRHDYRCTLTGRHDHADCLADFTDKLNRFFDGEHPTRLTYFDATETASSIKPARTVYTGNYVLRADALRYFVPFATLRLRMAGPALGRIIQAEIGPGFVSANLPLLHKRTVRETGQAEFRPGIEKTSQTVDIANEFERQFFGDVMLFSLEKLVAMGYPNTGLAPDITPDVVAQVLADTSDELRHRYRNKHAEILEKLAILRRILQTGRGWHHRPEFQHIRARLDAFLRNMTHNFGEDAAGYRLIESATHTQMRHAQLLDAILQYAHDSAVWKSILNKTQSTRLIQ